MRTSDGFGVKHIYFTGYSPYPATAEDQRLPHIKQKLTRQIHKTALGAEELVSFSHNEDATQLIADLKSQDFQIAALEQTSNSILLPKFHSNNKIALILGEEVNGINKDLLSLSDIAIEIPMHGKKESFNVSVACGISLYQIVHF